MLVLADRQYRYCQRPAILLREDVQLVPYMGAMVVVGVCGTFICRVDIASHACAVVRKAPFRNFVNKYTDRFL